MSSGSNAGSRAAITTRGLPGKAEIHHAKVKTAARFRQLRALELEIKTLFRKGLRGRCDECDTNLHLRGLVGFHVFRFLFLIVLATLSNRCARSGANLDAYFRS